MDQYIEPNKNIWFHQRSHSVHLDGEEHLITLFDENGKEFSESFVLTWIDIVEGNEPVKIAKVKEKIRRLSYASKKKMG